LATRRRDTPKTSKKPSQNDLASASSDDSSAHSREKRRARSLISFQLSGMGRVMSWRWCLPLLRFVITIFDDIGARGGLERRHSWDAIPPHPRVDRFQHCARLRFAQVADAQPCLHRVGTASIGNSNAILPEFRKTWLIVPIRTPISLCRKRFGPGELERGVGPKLPVENYGKHPNIRGLFQLCIQF
jgi:hypothetical protein